MFRENYLSDLLDTCIWGQGLRKSQKLEPLLGKAKELEKKYDWLGATDFYEKAIAAALGMKDFLSVVEFWERIGFCFYRAALQAELPEDFRRRMKLAVGAYEQAVMLFEKVEEDGKRAKINHLKAMVAFTSFWLATIPSEKKELIDEWWRLEIEALKDYEKANDQLTVARICNNLLDGCRDRIQVESEWSELKKSIEECIFFGEKAIKALSAVDNEYELARAYCWETFYYTFACWLRVIEGRRQEFGQKSLNYGKKALKLSENTKDAYLIGHSYMNAGLAEWSYTNNPFTALKFFKVARKYGEIAKDIFLIAMASIWMVFQNNHVTNLEEDPDKQRKGFRKSIEYAQDAIDHFRIFNSYPYLPFAIGGYSRSIMLLALIETNYENKCNLLDKAVKIGHDNMEDNAQWINTNPTLIILETLTTFVVILYKLSEMEIKVNKKKQVLEEASKYSEKEFNIRQRISPFDYWNNSHNQKNRALIQADIAKIETQHKKKRNLLEKAVSTMDNCLKLVEKDLKDIPLGWKNRYVASYYFWFGGILEQLYLLTKDKKTLNRAIEAYKDAIKIYNKAKLTTREAESYWQVAKVHDYLGDSLEAARNYEKAAEVYKLAGEKIPQLKEFYKDYSLYMQAWSQIEQARYSHSIEDYEEAKQHYERAAKLHESTSSWSYLTPNYLAWSYMEGSEGLSRKESTGQAKQTFQKAYEQFCNAEESLKQKLEEITSADEKEMTQKLFEASDLRRKYCQARILMEDAKLLDREGKHLQSSRGYGKAAQNISAIADKLDVEAERKELKYVAILCQAWEKMTNAEETTSSKSYLKAATLFEQAKEHCFTKKASLWALGNSNFCRGLAAGVQYQTSLELSEHAKAKSFMKSAATNYSQAGFKNASEYARATQRLFDAYAFMNQAENELDQEKRSKQYQMAENLLQIAAGSFMKAKQPEKTAQVQKILANVREEKALAISLSQVMQAPSIASTTQSFTAPSPTSEVSVGLESFQHANVQANLITVAKEVKVGESFCLSVEFVNAGREPALLTRVEDFVPQDFVVVKKPEIYRIEETVLNMKGKQLAPLKLVEVKLVLQPSKKGNYKLNPRVHYLDELGQNKSLQLKTLEIKVEEVVLGDRVSTGTQELDSLLLGGVPKGYAVALTGPPSDEREILIKNFLESGTNNDEIVFYVATEAIGMEHLLENPNFFLFLCNPKPKTEVPNIANVFKLRSKTDITNLSISLAKAYRNIETSKKKKICVEIVSDVLISYKAEATRRWISELITDLGSKGFTMLAVMDPSTHPTDQANAVLNLFDGEIELTQKEDPLEYKKSVRVKKLRNQDYIKNPICLTI
jgi:KaiC/GvpD/RAD55 family RecA-like ATPase/tetratricopeptide (TPR) repeat protein